MGEPFRGVINIDIKQSTPDWAPYTQPKAPEGASSVLYIVLDDVGFGAMEPFGGPELSKPRTRYTYFPGGAEVPESQAPNIRGRSYTIAAEVQIDSEGAGGVLFSQGSRFGGHALYVKNGKLAYAYNFVGDVVQVVESSQQVPTGLVVLSASFERQGDTMPPQGTLTLYIRDQNAGEGRIQTQPGKFGLGGGGLVVGRSGAEPVTDDYPGQRPWAFTGGTITRVIIDVSGTPFADLAKEAAAAYARQ